MYVLSHWQVNTVKQVLNGHQLECPNFLLIFTVKWTYIQWTLISRCRHQYQAILVHKTWNKRMSTAWDLIKYLQSVLPDDISWRFLNKWFWWPRVKLKRFKGQKFQMKPSFRIKWSPQKLRNYLVASPADVTRGLGSRSPVAWP